MRRWGQIADKKSDTWFKNIAKKVYRPDIDAVAAKELIAEGKVLPPSVAVVRRNYLLPIKVGALLRALLSYQSLLKAFVKYSAG